MKCSTCGKEIPVTSQVCPFCYTAIKHDTEEVASTEDSLATINTSFQSTSNNDELNFGDLNQNTSFDEEHNTLKTYFQEPKQRKKILIPIIGVLVFFVILFVILNMFKEPTIDSYKYYTGVVDKVYEYISDNFTSSDAKNSGSYKLVYTINNEKTKEFRGKYQYDLSKKLIDITADLKDPEKENGGVIVGDQTLGMELYGKNNELYFSSNNIFTNVILLPYEDETGFLTSKQYDLNSLVDGIRDATNYALKNMTFTEEKKVNINTMGKSFDVKKKVLKLDYITKRKFVNLFFTELADDSNFTTEYAKVIGKKMGDVENLLNSYRTTYEHQFSVDNGKVTYINLYYKGKDVYRVEFDRTQDDDGIYTFDLDKNKLSYSYVKDGQTITSVNINRIDTTMNEVLTRTYNIDIKNNDDIITINIELTKDINPVVKAKEFENVKSIRDFTNEEINTIKSNVKVYTDRIDWIDDLKTIFKSKCDTNLSCVCTEGDTCQCTYENRVITCPKELVQVPENNTTTTE